MINWGDVTRQRDLGTVNCETVGLSGQVHFRVKFQFLVIKVFFFMAQGGLLSHGKSYDQPAFRQKKWRSEIL